MIYTGKSLNAIHDDDFTDDCKYFRRLAFSTMLMDAWCLTSSQVDSRNVWMYEMMKMMKIHSWNVWIYEMYEMNNLYLIEIESKA